MLFSLVVLATCEIQLCASFAAWDVISHAPQHGGISRTPVIISKC